jgi:NTP pyrophosphatase (non-canonical NTP hydrolase)
MTTQQFENIRQWADDRNLIEGSKPVNQVSKLVEELGELATGVNKNKVDLIADGIGDAVVVLTILAKQCGLNIEDCIDIAWNEIKDRKGRMVDGIFIKEADL